jgi:hypothetical protein
MAMMQIDEHPRNEDTVQGDDDERPSDPTGETKRAGRGDGETRRSGDGETR